MPLPPVNIDSAIFSTVAVNNPSELPSQPCRSCKAGQFSGRRLRRRREWGGRLVGTVAELADSPKATYWRERLAVSVRFKAAQGLVPGLVDGNPL